MGDTHFDNVISQGSPVATFIGAGNHYYFDPTNGNDGYTGTSTKRAKATFLAAYNLLEADQNDVLHYIPGPGVDDNNKLSAAFTWGKDYTHFIGHGPPTGVANRTRLFQLSTLTGASPLFTISATGCIFKNFYIFQGVNDATSLINVSVTGGRNYFQDVHFAGGGHTAMAINGGASLHLNAAEENRFVNCTIGVDTIASATGHVGLLMDGEAHRQKFEQCYFTQWSGDAAAGWVEIVDGTGIDRYNIMRECLFTNTGTSFNSGFIIPAMSGPRFIYLLDSFQHGADDWDDADRGVLFINNGTYTTGGNSGIMSATVTA